MNETVVLGHVERLDHQLDHLFLGGRGQIRRVQNQDGVVFGHHVQHAVHGVVDYLFDVVPLVHFALDDGPEGFEVLEPRDYVVADDEVVKVGVNAVAVRDD